MAKVTDRADGTYSMVFTASSPGAYLLAVTLNNKPIKVRHCQTKKELFVLKITRFVNGPKKFGKCLYKYILGNIINHKCHVYLA